MANPFGGWKTNKPDLFDLEDISTWRSLRNLVNSAKFLLRIFSKDEEIRSYGIKKCGDPPYLSDAVPFLEEMINDELIDPKIRWLSRESVSLIQFSGNLDGKDSFDDRVSALKTLGELKSFELKLESKILKMN